MKKLMLLLMVSFFSSSIASANWILNQQACCRYPGRACCKGAAVDKIIDANFYELSASETLNIIQNPDFIKELEVLSAEEKLLQEDSSSIDSASEVK